MTHLSVKVQIAPESVPTTPSWFGEVAIVAHVCTQFGLLDAIQQRVRFARARFGSYDTIDFLVVLIGYAVSGEATLQAFYERLWPFAPTFMALFGRHALPCQSTLSRFLAALDQPSVEALRLLFRGGIWSPEPRSVLLQAGCGIVWATTGSWPISMAPNKWHDNGPFPRHRIFLPRTAVLSRCAPKAISGANEDKWDERGRRCCNRTPINGLAPFLVQVMAITAQNCDTPCKPSRCMRRRVHCLSPTSSCAWMACMETRPLSMRFSRANVG